MEQTTWWSGTAPFDDRFDLLDSNPVSSQRRVFYRAALGNHLPAVNGSTLGSAPAYMTILQVQVEANPRR